MQEVRRHVDDELCGHVAQRDGTWCALVVFGAELGRHPTREDAVAQVLSEGLASLAERWMMRGRDDETEQMVCILEANSRAVTVAMGYDAMAGVPTTTIPVSEIVSGDRVMHRSADSS